MPPGKNEPIPGTGHWPDTLASAGITADSVFSDPRIKPWRNLDGRDNATLDLPGHSRLHIKRYSASPGIKSEVAGLTLLKNADIPTLELAAWAELPDGRSFVMTEDLAGYQSCQEILRSGGTFADVSAPTAALAARLHAAGLRHRDLYLCHFFLRRSDNDCRLIDVARVAKLPRLFPRRWVVKDLGQFAYSAREFDVPRADLDAWFRQYAGDAGPAWARAAERKADAIARHDAKLRLHQPARNISIPRESRA